MKGFFFEGYNLVTILVVIGMIAALVLLNEITRKNRIASYLMYVALPIIIVILIALNVVGSPSTKNWFGTVKTLSAVAGVVGFMAIRYNDKVAKSKFAIIFPVLILVINCLEAIYRDAEYFVLFSGNGFMDTSSRLWTQGGIWNILNALAGVFMILSLTGFMGIKVAKTKSQDMVWADQLWFWVIGYDLWNIAYCYNCISTRAMYSGVVLIVSCTIAEFFILKGCWLQHRAQTLAMFGMFSLVFDYQAIPQYGITATYNPAAWTTLSAIALVFNIGLFAYVCYTAITKKRNILKEELFVDSKHYKANLEANNLI